MRTLEHISPSSLSTYQFDPKEFYLRYLSDVRMPREPQTRPMAVGSAFDAYIKAYLHKQLFGGKDPRFHFDNIFEAQVEPHQRDWAKDHGAYVFSQYKDSGCLSDLMLELQNSPSEPRFEFEVKGAVHGYREGVKGNIKGITLLGKPDVSFVSKHGVHCVLDFKVNGYCATRTISPAQYYLRMRSAGRTNHGCHSKCVKGSFNGLEYNKAATLDEVNKDWAQQLSIYGWLLGEPVGAEFITIIHQISCTPSGALPKIRIAEHVNLIDPKFQQNVFDQCADLWERATSGHFFKEVSLEQSIGRCKLIERAYNDSSGNVA